MNFRYMNYLSTNNAHKSGHTRSIAVNQTIGTFFTFRHGQNMKKCHSMCLKTACLLLTFFAISASSYSVPSHRSKAALNTALESTTQHFYGYGDPDHVKSTLQNITAGERRKNAGCEQHSRCNVRRLIKYSTRMLYLTNRQHQHTNTPTHQHTKTTSTSRT